jgi:hypothetical protein
MVMTIGNRLPNDLLFIYLFIYLYIPLPIRGGSLGLVPTLPRVFLL